MACCSMPNCPISRMQSYATSSRSADLLARSSTAEVHCQATVLCLIQLATRQVWQLPD